MEGNLQACEEPNRRSNLRENFFQTAQGGGLEPY
jgi:hypothetical protein